MILHSIPIAAVKESSSGIYFRLNFNFEIIANKAVYINFKKAEAALSWKIGFSKKLFAFRLLINLSVYWCTIFDYRRNHRHSFERITAFFLTSS